MSMIIYLLSYVNMYIPKGEKCTLNLWLSIRSLKYPIMFKFS